MSLSSPKVRLFSLMSHLGSTTKSSPLLENVFIVAASRTPIGSFKGSLSSVSAPKLGSVTIKHALGNVQSKSNVIPSEVIMGNVLSGNLGQAPARQAALGAGLSETTICTTINKVCSSGLKAVQYGAQSIMLGYHSIVVAGGMENMSQAPLMLDPVPARLTGYGAGHQTLIDSMIKDGLWDAKYQIHMGECAERTAEMHQIPRDQQDEHAILSYGRASKAWEHGLFSSEIAPVTLEPIGKKKQVIPNTVTQDEEFTKLNMDKLRTLKGSFRNDSLGTITAANSSSISDGASALVLVSETECQKQGIKPLAKILAFADAETDPRDFPIAPSLAIPLALKRAQLNIDQIDLFEINEAFSVVILANQKILGLNAEKVNVRGGGVSLGHPIGSSGSRILVTLVHALQPGQRGCAAVCNGGGGASAMIIERL